MLLKTDPKLLVKLNIVACFLGSSFPIIILIDLKNKEIKKSKTIFESSYIKSLTVRKL